MDNENRMDWVSSVNSNQSFGDIDEPIGKAGYSGSVALISVVIWVVKVIIK